MKDKRHIRETCGESIVSEYMLARAHVSKHMSEIVRVEVKKHFVSNANTYVSINISTRSTLQKNVYKCQSILEDMSEQLQ